MLYRLIAAAAATLAIASNSWAGDVTLIHAGELLAVNVSSCQFTYNPGAGFRHGLVTLRIVVDDQPSGERVALLHQVHVVNVP